MWTAAEQQESLEWFLANVQILVLEMPGSVISNSREILPDLQRHGLRARTVAGYDFGTASADFVFKAAIRDGSIPEGFDSSDPLDEVHAAKVARAASYFRALTLAREASVPKPITLVLEDGVALADDFRHKLWALIREEIPCNWVALSLSSSCPIGSCTSQHLARLSPDPKLSTLERCEFAAAGLGGALFRTAQLQDFQNLWMNVAFAYGHAECLSLHASLSAISDKVAVYAVPAVHNPWILQQC
mmetsp:Transcript_44957/g.80771  ORF Transcript_44957/g.80771 Transcript_44957/m.80771 type:complete len:245 (+) Transcript_44957:2-736(+)